MNAFASRVGLPVLGIAAVILAAGCSGVSDLTRERVARSENAVRQAQDAVGSSNSESGALELQRARDNVVQARQAMDQGKEVPANRYAQLAQLDAELAVATAQSASARKVADELQASIQMLREEAARGAPLPSQ
jgi:Domain of unknown function (DUF4398)